MGFTYKRITEGKRYGWLIGIHIHKDDRERDMAGWFGFTYTSMIEKGVRLAEWVTPTHRDDRKGVWLADSPKCMRKKARERKHNAKRKHMTDSMGIIHTTKVTKRMSTAG